jgi:uncharacterized protein (TIGR00299 family) protein
VTAGRVAYVQCRSGIAGDMLLGALVDAGADPHAVAAAVDGLGLGGYAIAFERVQRAGVAATWANVVTDPVAHPHRPVADIRRLLAAADLPDGVAAAATRVFDALAEVEGKIHGVDPDDVELHEVGALDAIVDVVGTCAALASLGIGRLVAGPLAVGHGTIRSAHGELPNPAPATVALLSRRVMPIVGVDTELELATPTGVALLSELAHAFGPLPELTVEAVGYGAGRADTTGRPNVVQVIVGTERAGSVTPAPGAPAVLLEVNVDDVTGEVLAHAIAALIAAGAHDAWATPIVMKKGRPSHTVTALVDPALAERVAAILLAETGSLGIRATTVARWPQRRTDVTVDVDGWAVRVKLAAGRAKPEHDDAARAARALGLPLREVLRRAETLALASGPDS